MEIRWIFLEEQGRKYFAGIDLCQWLFDAGYNDLARILESKLDSMEGGVEYTAKRVPGGTAAP